MTLAQNAGSYNGPASQIYRTGTSKISAPPLLIRFSPAEDRTLDGLTEDLNIMAHLLEKSLERGFNQDAPAVKMGIPMILSLGSPSVRAMYLEGFGTLFIIKVNFPLVGADSAEEKKIEQVVDSEWDDAKREVLGEKKQTWESSEVSSAADYDPGQIEGLKAGLLQALKNASHIRYVKPEDFVSVTVFGTPTLIQKNRSPKNYTSKSSGGSKGVEVKLLDPGARRGTVMTIRVKKSDVDAFARQKLTLEEFQKRTTINCYMASGYATASLNTWSQSSSLGGALAP
jgi:hypothetical protein